MNSIDLARTVWAYLMARLDIDTDNEAGLTTTEIAVVTFLLVGAAIVVMGIIYNAAKNNANNIPDPKAPGTP
ncbi:MAG: hypothetical protein ABIW46_05550 [Acidimicrobiales bacterium]